MHKNKYKLSENVSQLKKMEDVYLWVKKMLNDWDLYLQNNLTEQQKSTMEGKQQIGIYR